MPPVPRYLEVLAEGSENVKFFSDEPTKWTGRKKYLFYKHINMLYSVSNYDGSGIKPLKLSWEIK
jgi:hypothetical protein